MKGYESGFIDGQSTLVRVASPELSNPDPKVWKPFYKRLCGMAKLKGYPYARCLPGLGWTHFDGTKFRLDKAHVVFQFDSAKDHNRFIDKVKCATSQIEVFTTTEAYFDSIFR